MKHSRLIRLLLGLSALALVLAFCIRSYILKHSLDVAGVLMTGSQALTWTVIFSCLTAAGLTALCLRLNRLPGTESCFSDAGVWLFPGLLAAIFTLFGAGLRLLGHGTLTKVSRLAEIAGLLAALSMAAVALLRERLGKGLFWLRLLPALYAAACLLTHFRSWTQDPMILDITPQLLTCVCFMLGAVLLSGFPLGAGHRRSTVLFGLLAAIFLAMSLPDYLLAMKTDRAELLSFAGLSLWCAVHSLQLLRPAVQTELPPQVEIVEDDPEPAEAEAPAD